VRDKKNLKKIIKKIRIKISSRFAKLYPSRLELYSESLTGKPEVPHFPLEKI
jgi:hypothetical protein